jgi:hypothetical protein
MVKNFSTYLNESHESDTVFTRNHSQWCSMYPQLEEFNLETDYVNGNLVWQYTLEKESISMYLEIKKSYNSWSLCFETVTSEGKTQQEKHYRKSGLSMNMFQIHLSNVSSAIKIEIENQ